MERYVYIYTAYITNYISNIILKFNHSRFYEYLKNITKNVYSFINVLKLDFIESNKISIVY